MVHELHFIQFVSMPPEKKPKIYNDSLEKGKIKKEKQQTIKDCVVHTWNTFR